MGLITYHYKNNIDFLMRVSSKSLQKKENTFIN